MKTQNFGESTPSYFLCFNRPFFPFFLSLKNYRKNRENGLPQDNPKEPFPSAGFDALDIKSSGLRSSDEWPDKQGRYWWKLTLADGRINEDFYWTRDKVRGSPDTKNQDRYWFIVHHKNGTKIEGFSQEPDYKKGFPDKDKNYWYTIRFTDTHCPAIAQWVKKKDENYEARLKCENQAKQQEVTGSAYSSSSTSSAQTSYPQPVFPHHGSLDHEPSPALTKRF